MRQGTSRLYVVSLELLSQDRWFDELWKDHNWKSLFSGDFWCSSGGGLSLDWLRYLLPRSVQFYTTSANLLWMLFKRRYAWSLKPDTRVIYQWLMEMVPGCASSINSFCDLDFFRNGNGGKLHYKFLFFFSRCRGCRCALTPSFWTRREKSSCLASFNNVRGFWMSTLKSFNQMRMMRFG